MISSNIVEVANSEIELVCGGTSIWDAVQAVIDLITGTDRQPEQPPCVGPQR